MMSILAPKRTRTTPKVRVRVWLERERMRSLPNHAVRAEAMPTAATIFQLMRSSPERVLFTVAARAVRMTTASEVATACFCSRPSRATKAGTMRTPPPTPQRAPSSPAARPMAMERRISFTGGGETFRRGNSIQEARCGFARRADGDLQNEHDET